MVIKEIGVRLDSMASQDPLDHQDHQVLKASEGERDILGLKEMMVRLELRERRELLVLKVTLVRQETQELMESQELQERRENQACLEPLVSEELWEFRVCQENRDWWDLQAKRVIQALKELLVQLGFLAKMEPLDHQEKMELLDPKEPLVTQESRVQSAQQVNKESREKKETTASWVLVESRVTRVIKETRARWVSSVLKEAREIQVFPEIQA